MELKKAGEMGKCQNCNRGSLWKLVQCVPLLTSCKDARLLKTAIKFTGISCRIIVGGGANKKTTLTKYGIKKNKAYSTYQQNEKEPKLSKIVFPLYEGQELSLSNCYF